jgi:hypothetical protein
MGADVLEGPDLPFEVLNHDRGAGVIEADIIPVVRQLGREGGELISVAEEGLQLPLEYPREW